MTVDTPLDLLHNVQCFFTRFTSLCFLEGLGPTEVAASHFLTRLHPCAIVQGLIPLLRCNLEVLVITLWTSSCHLITIHAARVAATTTALYEQNITTKAYVTHASQCALQSSLRCPSTTATEPKCNKVKSRNLTQIPPLSLNGRTPILKLQPRKSAWA